jgi:DNA-directed RNA polymerase beta' subunit
MQRRIIKLMEDMHVANDGTIRDDCNRVYEFIYGALGMDTTGVPHVHDLVAAINTEIELTREQKFLHA